MRVHGIDHVEFYVADADTSAETLCVGYGFRCVGRINRPDHRSVLVRQGGIQLVFTAGLAAGHPAVEFVRRHGDGPAVIALATDEPHARLVAFGDVTHTFVTPGELSARFPGTDEDDLLAAIDHVAVCVPAGELDRTIAFYRRVLGFDQIFAEYIEIGDQAMNSKVVQSPNGEVTLTMLEPDDTQRPGQIDEFIAAHGGAGVQHLALRTNDIVTSVRTLSGRGVDFLTTPGAYYDELERRLGAVGVPIGTLRELNVLVDRDEVGELFQIFARSTHPRRTFFMEIIERRDALTFGSANIKALYQAVERERKEERAQRHHHQVRIVR